MSDFADYIIFDVKFIWEICFKLLQKFNHAKGHNVMIPLILYWWMLASVDTCIYVFAVH